MPVLIICGTFVIFRLRENFALGQVVTLDISQVTTYDVCFINNWLTNWVFNSSSMVAG